VPPECWSDICLMTDHMSSIQEAAHHFGAYAAARYPGKSWDEIEADLRRGWETPEQHLEAGWDEIKAVVHDAWSRA
jgi:hypothetical protein